MNIKNPVSVELEICFCCCCFSEIYRQLFLCDTELTCVSLLNIFLNNYEF